MNETIRRETYKAECLILNCQKRRNPGRSGACFGGDDDVSTPGVDPGNDGTRINCHTDLDHRVNRSSKKQNKQ